MMRDGSKNEFVEKWIQDTIMELEVLSAIITLAQKAFTIMYYS
jgi:hypothetical protein